MYGVLRSEGYSERAIFVIDKHGVIRYVDVHDIDEQPDNEVLFAVLEQIEGVRSAVPEPRPQPAAPLPASPGGEEADLVMYCNQWCPACRRARAFLQQHGIQYIEIDIARNREAAEQVRRWNKGSETTPTFDVKGKIVANFIPSELAAALGIEID